LTVILSEAKNPIILSCHSEGVKRLKNPTLKNQNAKVKNQNCNLKSKTTLPRKTVYTYRFVQQFLNLVIWLFDIDLMFGF
jgi:hypothetical protein